MGLVYSEIEYISSSPGNFTPTLAPSPGNLLVITAHTRAASDKLLAITGWTIVESAMASDPPSAGSGLSMFYRVAQSGDTVWSIAASQCDLSYSEWSGYTTLVDSASHTVDPGAAPYAIDCGGAVTPGAVGSVLVIGAISMSLQNDTDSFSGVPDGGVTELDDWQAGGHPNGSPGRWSAYILDDTPSGSYTPSGLGTVGGTTNPYAGITAAFSGAGAPTPPVVVDIYDEDGVTLVTIERPLDWGIRIEEDGPGSGFLVVDRNDAQATAANLARGNFVRVVIPEIDPTVPVFEWIMEEGDFDLVSSDEEGGEELRFGGAGSLKYLDYARLYEEEEGLNESIIVPADNVWRFSGQTVGRMVKKLITEAAARTNYLAASDPPMPLLTYTFGAVNDTAAAAWLTIAGLWEMQIGSSVYDEVMRFVGKDLAHVRMNPGLVLDMWEGDPGVDRTSTTFAANKVRFVKGVNVSSEMKGQTHGGVWYTHAIVRAKAEWIRVGLAAGTFDYRKETTLDYSGVTDTNTAARAAAGAFLHSDEAQTPYILEHITPHPGDAPDDALGLYLPGPPGSANGRYWVGDLVTLHTGGTGFGALSNVTQRVYAITLRPDEVGDLAPPIVELNAPFTNEATESPLGSGQGGSSGGSSGGSAAHGHAQYALAENLDAHVLDTADAHDASAVSFAPTGTIAATDVQAAIAEVDGDLTAHLADATDAHDASAISFAPNGSIAATDVQAAIQEVRDEATGSALTVSDEGTPLATAATTLDFVGAGVVASGVGATKTITISGGSGSVATDAIFDAKGDLPVGTGADTAARLAAAANGASLITASGETTGLKWRLNNDGAAAAPTVNDDTGDGYSIGSRWLDTTADKEYVCLDTTAAAAVWVETTATGGASTIKYGGLKPATPLDDFAGSALDGAWSAHSSQGSFATTDCYTQARDGSHLSMGFQAKNGRLYRAATDVDQEWLVGGIIPDGGVLTGTEVMFSIALVNTVGTGICIVVYNDSNAYFASMTTWGYGAFTGTFAGYGHNLLRHGPYALRITRVGNVFTGYISIDGQAWVAASATITSAFTVAYKSVGLAYNPATAYKGRLFVDWVHTA